MTDPEVTACRSDNCRAPIIFATSAATGRLMPFDAVPVESGTFRLDEDLFDGFAAVHVPAGERPARLYRSHFASCPDAPSWRRNEVQS